MPPKQKKQEPQRSDAELIAIIAGAIAIGAPPAATAASLAPILGVSAGVALAVVKLAMSKPTTYGTKPLTTSAPSASTESQRTEALFRAQYILAASRRVAAAVAEGVPLAEAERTEERFYNQHLQAMVGRRKAAAQVDSMAKRHGDLLGWYAKMDSRTSAECKEANGKNFNVSVRPPIGYPGTVHPNCRCKAGKPHGTRATVYSIQPEERAS
jgi:SPP1 gp7 family putative phage head morphogenesis protein